MQVFGRNWTGTIDFNDVLCSQNTAEEAGGCYYSAGRGTVTNGTTMEENVSGHGGCICERITLFPGSTEAIASVGGPERIHLHVR